MVLKSSKVILGTNRERVCDFLLVINSNFGRILPGFRDIAGFLRRATHPYSTRIVGVPDVVAPRTKDRKLIIRVSLKTFSQLMNELSVVWIVTSTEKNYYNR